MWTSRYYFLTLVGALLIFQNCGRGFQAGRPSQGLNNILGKSTCTTESLPEYRPSALTNKEIQYVVEDLFSSTIADSSAVANALSQIPEIQVDRRADLSNYQENNPGTIAGDLYLAQLLETSEEVYGLWSQQADFKSQCGNASQGLKCFEFTRNVIERLWRRPLSDQEFDFFLEIFSKPVDLAKKVELAFITAMGSPQFYLKNYSGIQGGNRVVNFSSYELASRFSFFLFNSLPDPVLWEEVRLGKIRTPADLLPHVDRLLAQEKYLVRFMNHAITPWLGIQYDLENKQAVQNQDGVAVGLNDLAYSQLLSFKDLIKNNGPLSEFFYGGKVYLNDKVALYLQDSSKKFPTVAGGDFKEVTVPKEVAFRAGFFASPYFAYKTRHSATNETRVSKRGIFLSEKFLCQDIPVNEVSPEDVVRVLGPHADQLKQIQVGEIRRKHPSCLGCHQEIDKYGIGFESLNQFGKLRSTYGDGTPITYSLLMSPNDTRPVTNFDDFLKSLSKNTQLHQCFIRYMSNKMAPLNTAFEQPCAENAITLNSRLGIRDQIKGLVASQLFSHARKPQ